MTSDKEIWLDVDGVLLDWCRPFLAYHHQHNKLKYDDIADYSFSNFYTDQTKLSEDICTFNLSAEYRELPALANVMDLKQLADAGYKLHIITQIMDDDTAVKKARIENLACNFPGLFSSVHFTFKGQDKLQTILNLRPTGRIIVVEDNPTFLKRANATVEDELHRIGHTRLFTFGIRHPYNKIIESYPYIVTVDSMADVTKMILSLEGKRYVA